MNDYTFNNINNIKNDNLINKLLIKIAKYISLNYII